MGKGNDGVVIELGIGFGVKIGDVKIFCYFSAASFHPIYHMINSCCIFVY